jgi:anthranilate phosphoribosyltransferase
MNIKHYLQPLLNQQHLTATMMTALMQAIINGELSEAQIGGLLVAFAGNGVNAEEISAARDILWQHAVKIEHSCPQVLDIVGTGGDGFDTFNVSTTSAFVAAAAGATVAKHGSRAASSQSGSADVLRSAGINIECGPAQVVACLAQLGISFIFAPVYHPAWRYATPVRRSLGIPTIFNLLGPLLNPTAPTHLCLGVYHRPWCLPAADALSSLQHVLVINGDDGCDEISLQTSTQILDCRDGEIKSINFSPEDVGIKRQDMALIAVESPEQSLQTLQAVLANQAGPALDMVLLNAGAAIYCADLVASIADGVELARQTIAAGAALEKFNALKELV